jgi:hypothetical protein
MDAHMDRSTDGEVGTVGDLLFEDAGWVFR